MKILVFGRGGQVGRHLAQAPGVIALGRDQADLTDPAAGAAAIRAHAPDAVINAAAFTAVDRAETEEPLARAINAAAPGAMARTCAELAIPLVQISTDYVFDGSGTRPWRPDDRPAPINAYGRSKLAGEEAVREAGGPHAILRTSWVFSAHGRNFVRTMLSLAQNRSRLDVVGDQTGGPTPAEAIARACLSMARQLADDPAKTGIYHLAGAPDTTWEGFARETFARAGRIVEVHPVASAAWPAPAARPLNSRLDCRSTAQIFSIPRPDWKAGLDQVLARAMAPAPARQRGRQSP